MSGITFCCRDGVKRVRSVKVIKRSNDFNIVKEIEEEVKNIKVEISDFDLICFLKNDFSKKDYLNCGVKKQPYYELEKDITNINRLIKYYFLKEEFYIDGEFVKIENVEDYKITKIDKGMESYKFEIEIETVILVSEKSEIKNSYSLEDFSF